MLTILIIFGIICMTFITISLEIFSVTYAVYFCFAFYTLTISFTTPIYTTSMDYVIELTYPVGESISEGLIMTGNQLFGVIAP